MLTRRADIARHVRELVIRPRTMRVMRHSFYNSTTASAAVRDVATSMRLDALTTFAWDDEELPYYDDMWFALRVGCVKCYL